MARRMRLIKVWHHRFAGEKVWVVRGWFQDFLYPKHFSDPTEKTYACKRHMNYWDVLGDIGVIKDRTSKKKVSWPVKSYNDILDYFRKFGD